jgi:hypothetical protein
MADSTASAARTKKQSASERKQNRRIQQLIDKTAKLTTDLTTLDTKVSGIDTRLGGIEAAAPVIVAALTKLGDAYQAVEYGRAGIFASNGTVAAGSAVTSADIPDDGNAVTTGEDAIVVSNAPGAVGIDLRAAIRSNESDGDDTSKTAGQAGGYLFVVNLDTGARVACGGTPNPPGVIGTVAGDSIVTPSGTVTNLTLKNIPGGVLRTDTSKPDATSTSLLPAACQFGAGAAGITYSVHYSVNFVDIPTSTTPGPKE